MKFSRFGALLAALAYTVFWQVQPVWSRTSADPAQVEISVARLLEQGHYTREKIDDRLSGKILESYLRILDPNRLYFLQSDIDSFTKKYASTLDEAILRGDLTPVQKIYAVYKQRVEDRLSQNKEILKKKLDFDTNDTVSLNREKAPWPKDLKEADFLWNQWIRAEVLQERLAAAHFAKTTRSRKEKDPPPSVTKESPRNVRSNPQSPLAGNSPLPAMAQTELSAEELAHLLPPKSAEETVARRFENTLKNLEEEELSDVFSKFFLAIAQSYDPHSEYMSPEEMENFAISMKLSLVGIGALLRSDDGYTRIAEIIPGGPADKDGRLKVNDRIIAVTQGDHVFEDVVNMKLDKVVEKIRGKKGTTVKLLVISGDSTDGSKRKLIEITRDEVKLKDQEAKAEVIDIQRVDKSFCRIGIITLPSFYANMDSQSSGSPVSTTRDVSTLLKRLQLEGIEGLIVDLRRNGGGSLQEAISLTGLFVPKGPVVQAKDSAGRITVSYCDNPKPLYSGPLIVLVNHLSASASEIFAAALQDYSRAVIVGDSTTFCKGTVQTVLDVGRFMPFFSLGASDAGSLKLTIQKFYRIQGGATQLKGVESNIIIPSLTDSPLIGEGALPNALAYDEVAPVPFQKFEPEKLFLEQLSQRSAARVAMNPEFSYIREEMLRMKKKIQGNQLSLNEAERKAELNENRVQKKRHERERASRGPDIEMKDYIITLENVNKPQLVFAKDEKKPIPTYRDSELASEDSTGKLQANVIKNETLRIMEDLIDLNNAAQKKKTTRFTSRTTK